MMMRPHSPQILFPLSSTVHRSVVVRRVSAEVGTRDDPAGFCAIHISVLPRATGPVALDPMLSAVPGTPPTSSQLMPCQFSIERIK